MRAQTCDFDMWKEIEDKIMIGYLNPNLYMNNMA